MAPFEFVEGWKLGDVRGHAQNAERAIDAVTLRVLLRRAGT